MDEILLKLIRENINDENKKEFYLRFKFAMFLFIFITFFTVIYVFTKENWFSLIIFLFFYWIIIVIINGINGIIDKSIFYIAYPGSNNLTEFKNILIVIVLIYILPFFMYSIINEAFPGFIFILSFFGAIILFFGVISGFAKIIDFFS